MEKYRIDEITINLDNLRKPLNNSERSKISKKKLYPYYGANNLMDYVDEYIFDEEILCVAEDGGSWGYKEKCSYVVNEKCWVNNHAHVLKAKDNLNLKYLNYYLNYNDLKSKITGTTRGKLTKSALNSIEVLLPNRTEQDRIVNVLDKSQELIVKRKVQIETLDELVKSKFIEMFGNPIKLIGEGFVVSLETITGDIGVGFVGESTNEYIEKGIPYLRMQNIRPMKIDEQNLIYINEAFHKKIRKSNVFFDDIVISRVGINRGMTAVIPKEFNNSSIGNAIIIRANSAFNSLFIAFYINMIFGKHTSIGYSKGSAQGAISVGLVKKWPIPNVSLNLQNEFAEFFKQIDKVKIEMQESLTQLEDNFNSLMQRAFKGELFN